MFHQLSPQSQKIAERLKTLEQEVSGGATAVVALILNNKLYIANVGTYTHTRTHTQEFRVSQMVQYVGYFHKHRLAFHPTPVHWRCRLSRHCLLVPQATNTPHMGTFSFFSPASLTLKKPSFLGFAREFDILKRSSRGPSGALP